MGGLTIAEQFLMISTKLPTRYLYGFGENTHDTFLHDMKYRMWPIFTRDIAPSFVRYFVAQYKAILYRSDYKINSSRL